MILGKGIWVITSKQVTSLKPTANEPVLGAGLLSRQEAVLLQLACPLSAGGLGCATRPALPL